jgi:glucose 1-dehydrogenase
MHMNAFSKPDPKAMMLRVLEGQRAIVTGANSGIGEAVARGLAEAGAKVVVNYVVGDEQAKRVVDDITKSGGEAIAVQADVSKEDQVRAMFERAIDAFGSVDILVNNAGCSAMRRFTKCP